MALLLRVGGGAGCGRDERGLLSALRRAPDAQGASCPEPESCADRSAQPVKRIQQSFRWRRLELYDPVASIRGAPVPDFAEGTASPGGADGVALVAAKTF